MSSEFANYGYQVSVPYLILWTYYHDLARSDFAPPMTDARSCTGVLIRGPSGVIFHGRIMDNEPPPALRLLTLHLLFTRGGRVVYEAGDYYWFNGGGFVTGILPGVATLQENSRVVTVAAADLLKTISLGAVPQGLWFRYMFEHFTTYQDMLNYLIYAPIAAPWFAVIGGVGPNEGAVVTRSATFGGVPPVLPCVELNASRWYLAETNYDPWLPDPEQDPRRTIAEQLIAQMGQEGAGSIVATLAVVLTEPLSDPCCTVYAAAMSAGTSQFYVYAQQGDDEPEKK